MNLFVFTGRLAAAPELIQTGKTPVTRFRLIRNEYAGKDEQGERRERQVTVQFAAFGGVAEMLANHAFTGDQLIVTASISNNNYTDGDGVERYGFNFEVGQVEFGAPGPEKRRRLAAAAGASAP